MGKALSFGLFKGTVVAALVAHLGTTFGQSIAVAFVSGGLGVLGMLGAAIYTAKETRRNREMLVDVKRNLGAHRRATDEREQNGLGED